MAVEHDSKHFANGQARRYMKHKIYCSGCSHYEVEVAHWDGTSFKIDVTCAHCNNITRYLYQNPYDVNGWLK